MNKSNGILILSLVAFLSGNMNSASAIENTGNSYEIAGQTGGVSDNRICIGEDIAKELLKQAIYAASTKVLNKYINSGVPAVTAPVSGVPAYGVPATYTQPVTYTPPVTTAPAAFVPSFMPTAAPVVTAAPTATPGFTISQ